MVAAGDGSQGPGAKSSGAPKEHDVLSARPSPSEPGLASESAAGMMEGGREREKWERENDEEAPPWKQGGLELKGSALSKGGGSRGLGRAAAVAPNHLPRHVWWMVVVGRSGSPPPVCMAAPFAEVWGSCQNQSKCCVENLFFYFFFFFPQRHLALIAL